MFFQTKKTIFYEYNIEKTLSFCISNSAIWKFLFLHVLEIMWIIANLKSSKYSLFFVFIYNNFATWLEFHPMDVIESILTTSCYLEFNVSYILYCQCFVDEIEQCRKEQTRIHVTICTGSCMCLLWAQQLSCESLIIYPTC